MHHFASWANVVQTFWPVIRQPPSSLTALVLSEARSSRTRARRSPGTRSPRREDRLEKALLLRLGAVGDHDRSAHNESKTFAGRGAFARASSSPKMDCSIRVAPRPPYSLGHETPAQPASWSFFCHSRSNSNWTWSPPRGAGPGMVFREPGSKLVAERLLGLGQGEVHGRETYLGARVYSRVLSANARVHRSEMCMGDATHTQLILHADELAVVSCRTRWLKGAPASLIVMHQRRRLNGLCRQHGRAALRPSRGRLRRSGRLRDRRGAPQARKRPGSTTSSPRRSRRAISAGSPADCQSLMIIRCRSPKRSANSGYAASAPATPHDFSIAADNHSPIASMSPASARVHALVA